VIDGHDFRQIVSAYDQVGKDSKKPYMIIAKTIKGKGVSFIENKDNWHGKPLAAGDFERAVRELEPLDMTVRAKVQKPKSVNTQYSTVNKKIKIGTNYKKEDSIATRKAYGTALAQLGKQAQDIVVLDGDTKNSTYAEIFKAEFPDRYFEMFIAEQNMVGVAVGMSKRGYVPFVSSFAAFLSRGFDQIRMSAVSGANVKFCGSHAGVSIGEDGPSQMGLEDIALFRSIYGSTVFYPSDGVSSEKLTAQMYNTAGICYLRASRPNSPIIYENSEEFPVGGLKIHTLKSQIQNPKSKIIIISAGVTLHEALKAQSILKDDGIEAVVVDLYSLKPVDEKTIIKVSKDTGKVLTVEDHYQAGGIAEIVSFVLRNEANVKLESLFVKNMPKSGKPQELLAYEEIDCHAIVETAKKMLS
jgi:transketolase